MTEGLGCRGAPVARSLALQPHHSVTAATSSGTVRYQSRERRRIDQVSIHQRLIPRDQRYRDYRALPRRETNLNNSLHVITAE